jgi:DNA repair exonuclease SbcCD ATPase subunit
MALVNLKAMVSQLQAEISELRAKLAELEENEVYMTDHMRFVNDQSRLIISTMQSTKRSFLSAPLPSFLSNKSSASSESVLTEPETNIQSSFEEMLGLNERLHEARQSVLSKSRELTDSVLRFTNAKSELESIVDSLAPTDPIIARLRAVLDRMQS